MRWTSAPARRSAGPPQYAGAHLEVGPHRHTVEGANILTRSMIIYGQGAIRCHPYVREEMQAVAAGRPRAFRSRFFQAHRLCLQECDPSFPIGTHRRKTRSHAGTGPSQDLLPTTESDEQRLCHRFGRGDGNPGRPPETPGENQCPTSRRPGVDVSGLGRAEAVLRRGPFQAGSSFRVVVM